MNKNCSIVATELWIYPMSPTLIRCRLVLDVKLCVQGPAQEPLMPEEPNIKLLTKMTTLLPKQGPVQTVVVTKSAGIQNVEWLALSLVEICIFVLMSLFNLSPHRILHTGPGCR